MSSAGRPSVGLALATGALAGLAGAAAVTGCATLRLWQRGRVDEAPGIEAAGAIVVLGATQHDGLPSPVFRARLDHAIALWRAGRAPLLVMTGGGMEGDRTTEAETGRGYAIMKGVPADAILMEDRGRSTRESLRAVSAILEGRGVGAAVFVSDRSHMLRVMRIARDLGIEAYGSPATDSPSDASLQRRAKATAHELGALAWYGLAGRPSPERRAGARRA